MTDAIQQHTNIEELGDYMGCTEIEDILFIWDSDKERINIKKHRVDFETAALVYFDEHRINRYDFDHSSTGEQRYNVIGVGIDDILFVVDVETNRDDVILIISAREATKGEVDLYVQGLQES